MGRKVGKAAVLFVFRGDELGHHQKPWFHVKVKLFLKNFRVAWNHGRPAEHRWRPLFNTAKFG